MLCGGGTGGHITPLLAVAHELKRLQPDVHLAYVGEKNSKFAHMVKENNDVDAIHTVSAGKFRRYHKQSWLARLIDFKTGLLNLRDFGRLIAGFFQSLRLLRRLKPDVIFIKGGFVGVPIGLAAACLKIPYVTHDSDVMPGLANRLIARWAAAHAVGMPAELYGYPKQKTYFVGTPVPKTYQPVTQDLQNHYKKELNIPLGSQVVLITGGSLGAHRLNKAVEQTLPTLLEANSELILVHQAGKGYKQLYEVVPPVIRERLIVREFLPDLYRYSGAADVVITRAGASALAELSSQGKACIVVPNPDLAGGHQLKNAQKLAAEGAANVITEAELKSDPTLLSKAVKELLKNGSERKLMSTKLAHLSKTNAAAELAQLLINSVKRHAQ